MTPTKAEQLAARTSARTSPVHGWTDADADAGRLALELECILTDGDTPMAVTSRWWESAHEALAMHRRRISDELREIECPPDPDAVDRALDADALRADAEQAQEAQQPAGRASVDDWERELSAVMPADFKDWWQNSRREWPAVAAEVIKSLRLDRDAGWEVAARAQRREPLTASQVNELCNECHLDWHRGWSLDEEPNRYLELARAIEKHHGIGATTGKEPGNV
mgnify:CR=1 FL=1